jgi:hypothetical protein
MFLKYRFITVKSIKSSPIKYKPYVAILPMWDLVKEEVH